MKVQYLVLTLGPSSLLTPEVTMRPTLVHGWHSINCANNVVPTFKGGLPGNPHRQATQDFDLRAQITIKEYGL